MKTETPACNPCANAASGIIVCNNGVQEVIPQPPNTGGPWVLVWRNDSTPPGWDWQNAPSENPGGGLLRLVRRALFRKNPPR